MIVTKYNLATGEYLGTLSMELSDLLHPFNGNFNQVTEGLMEGERNGDLTYASNGIDTARPKLPVEDAYGLVADGSAELVLTGLPEGTIVNITDVNKTGRDPAKDVLHGTIDADASLAWATSIPSEYDLVLLPPFPWLVARARITAHAAG